MRVCVLTTSYPRYKGDYAGVFIHNYAKKLVEKGIIVKVIAPHDINTKSHEIIDGVEIHRFKYWFTKKSHKLAYRGGIVTNLRKNFIAAIQIFPFLFTFFLLGLRIGKKSDILHSHHLLSGFIGVLIKRIINKKIVTTAHGSDIFIIPKLGFLKKIYLPILKNSDLITVASSDNAKKLINLNFNKNLIKIAPNGIDLTIFNTNKKKKRNGIYILWVGRIVEIKGLEYLILAMKDVVNQNPNAKLTIIGEGPKKNDLEKLSLDFSLEKNIKFLGPINNEKISDYMNESDIFVLPSIKEGFGLVLIEAMAISLPVIGSKVGGIKDIIIEGVNGYLVESKNSEQLAEKINYLIKNPKIRINMGENGRKTVEEKYNLETISHELIGIYESLIKKDNYD